MKNFEGREHLSVVNEERKSLPIGSGEKIVKVREKLTLPVESVKNTVVWVNPAFPEAPLKLRLGRPTELGVFFTPTVQKDGKESKNLKISPEWSEGRSGLLGSVIFQDKNGKLYRDVDLKGVGFFRDVFGKYKVAELKKDKSNPLSAAGLMDYQLALRDQSYSEKLNKAGIRTHRVLAIVDLEEVVMGDGRKVSIEEIKHRGLISKKMRPVIEIRAFGTKDRIDFLNDRRLGESAIEDAKKIIAQEQGKDVKKISDEGYLRWFAKKLGEQIAKLRNLGLSHNYLQVHNITLDCRIVDLDSVDSAKVRAGEEKRPEKDVFDEDFFAARESLEFLANKVLSTKNIEHSHMYTIIDFLLKIYEAYYKKELQSKK